MGKFFFFNGTPIFKSTPDLARLFTTQKEKERHKPDQACSIPAAGQAVQHCSHKTPSLPAS